jgi:branched-chain amino acid transport system substrate-binding protein
MVRKVGMAALAACTISALATTMGWSADKPVFGLVMSFSGWFAPIDADTIAGAKLAAAEINAAGGVLGQPIEVVEFDNKSEPPLGADGAVDVIGKGAKAILFPSDFDFGAPGAYVAQQKDVIAFSGASDPKFGVQGVGPLAYSTSNASQPTSFSTTPSPILNRCAAALPRDGQNSPARTACSARTPSSTATPRSRRRSRASPA